MKMIAAPLHRQYSRPLKTLESSPLHNLGSGGAASRTCEILLSFKVSLCSRQYNFSCLITTAGRSLLLFPHFVIFVYLVIA